MTKNIFTYVLLTCCVFLLAACSAGRQISEDMNINVPMKGEAHLRLGMEKDEVARVWGDPDVVNVVEYDKMGKSKEEWIYFGQLTKVPVNYQYFSKTKYLYFDGNSLISFGEEKKEFHKKEIFVEN